MLPSVLFLLLLAAPAALGLMAMLGDVVAAAAIAPQARPVRIRRASRPR